MKTVPLLALLLGGLLAGNAWSAGESAAIRNVIVVPMDQDRVIPGQTVLVRDGIIARISDDDEATIPDGIPVIEGNGHYLAPGLMDLHTHLLTEDELTHYAAWGITTIMHLGGTGLPGTEVLALKNDVLDGKRFGPMLYTTNRVFDGQPRLNDRSLEITDPETARTEVRRLKEGGFDFVKIYNNLDRAEFDAVVAESRAQGLGVIGHIPRKFPALDSLSSGHGAIAHTEELFFTHFGGPRSTGAEMNQRYEADLSRLEPLLRALSANDVAVMPDLSFTFTNMLMWDGMELILADPEFAYLNPKTGSMWAQSGIDRRDNIENFILREQMKYELMLWLTRRFEDAGILQVIGTDAALPGLFPGKAAHRELTELIKAGLTNYEAYSAGTRNGGEFIRRLIDADVRLGQVREGYRANLALLEGNPLEDIRNARKVAGVMINGHFRSAEDLRAERNRLRDRYGRLNKLGERADLALTHPMPRAALERLITESTNETDATDVIESRITAAGYGAAYAGDMERSLSILTLNAELFPESAAAWENLARLNLHLERTQEALDHYRRALALDSSLDSVAEQIRQLEDVR